MDKPKPYRPSNGTEGDYFRADFCDQCRKDTEKRPCKILMNTMLYNIGDKEYPKQWIYGPEGPTCTAFDDRRIPKPHKPRRRHKPSKGQQSLDFKEGTP